MPENPEPDTHDNGTTRMPLERRNPAERELDIDRIYPLYTTGLLSPRAIARKLRMSRNAVNTTIRDIRAKYGSDEAVVCSKKMMEDALEDATAYLIGVALGTIKPKKDDLETMAVRIAQCERIQKVLGITETKQVAWSMDDLRTRLEAKATAIPDEVGSDEDEETDEDDD